MFKPEYLLIPYGISATYLITLSFVALIKKLLRERAYRRWIEAENLERKRSFEEQKYNTPISWVQLDFDFDYKMLRDRLLNQGYREETRGLFTMPRPRPSRVI